MGVLTSDPMLYSHNHSLDSIAEMVATTAGATVSNVVGMIGTEEGLSMRNAAMKVPWYGLLLSPLLRPRHPFFHHRLAQQDRRAAHPRSIYLPLQYPMSRLALRCPHRLRSSPLPHPRGPEAPAGSPEPVRAPGPLNASTLPESELARVCP